MTTKFRVWWKPQVPMESFIVEVPDVQTGRLVEEILANYDQFQYENNIKPDYCNTGGVQYWDEELQEWCDVDDDEDSADWA